MAESDFMSSWEDSTTVARRLAPALKKRGIISPVTSSNVSPLSNHSGLSGDLSALTLSLEDGSAMKLVLKRTRPNEDSKKYSKKLGLYREGVFYSAIGPRIQQRLDQIPRAKQNGFITEALFSASNSETGQKAIVLEYYSDSVEAGVHFPHSIHNVVREMQNGTTTDVLIPPEESIAIRRSITLEAVRIAALLHGTFYKDVSVFADTSFTENLRMADWVQGKGKETFLESQQEIIDRWSKARSRWYNGEFFDGKVKLGKEFLEVVDASCAQALDFESFVSKWDSQHESTDKISWSLVHGDYHPGNFLYIDETGGYNKSLDQPKLILVDWEVVGVGSGPQDIGQFLISHTETREAFDMLDEVTRVYRQTLQSTLDVVNKDHSDKPVAPSLEVIKREIIYGGIERWIWLFCYMAGWEESIPPMYMQYFHDQMQSFIVLNCISAKEIGMPRP